MQGLYIILYIKRLRPVDFITINPHVSGNKTNERTISGAGRKSSYKKPTMLQKGNTKK